MPKQGRGRAKIINGSQLKLQRQDLSAPKPGEKHPPPPGEEVPDLERVQEEQDLAQEEKYFKEFPALGGDFPPKLKQNFKIANKVHVSQMQVPVVGQQIPTLGNNGGECPIPVAQTTSSFPIPVRSGISGSLGMPRYSFPPPTVSPPIANVQHIPVQLTTATQRPQVEPFEPMEQFDQFSVSLLLKLFCYFNKHLQSTSISQKYGVN